MRGSMISLTAATVGAGMITLPYLMARTGLALGIILIILGALLSYYSGMLIVTTLLLKGCRYNVNSKQANILTSSWES